MHSTSYSEKVSSQNLYIPENSVDFLTINVYIYQNPTLQHTIHCLTDFSDVQYNEIHDIFMTSVGGFSLLTKKKRKHFS